VATTTRKGIVNGKMVLETVGTKSASPFMLETSGLPVYVVKKYIINGVIYEDHTGGPLIVGGGILAGGITLDQEVVGTDRTGTISNALTGISQSVTAERIGHRTGTASQALGGISQSATAYVEQTGTVSQALSGVGQSATAEIIPSAVSIVSVVPSTFGRDSTSIVITVQNIVTAGAVVRIDGLEQSITGSDATTITFDAVQGNHPDGAGLLEVIAA
jgi:hypothetical protein